MDCYYVPHGVDTEQYQPLDRTEARDKLGWPADRFVVGMVAANKGNPSRKALIQHIEAFAHFHKKHPDTALYLHTTRGENGEMNGVNLIEFAQMFGLSYTTMGRPDTNTDAAVWFCDQYLNLLGFPTPYMRHAYAAMDVHVLVSMGEGFGIPILEAQACGTPVIVGGWTAMPELCFAGEIVDVKHSEPFPTPLGAFQRLPRPGSIAAAMGRAYRKPGSSEKARKGALEYDARRVMKDYWAPVLAEIEQDVALWEGSI
jgi:glycosyltransferase involved in cell wall biosynthesis